MKEIIWVFVAIFIIGNVVALFTGPSPQETRESNEAYQRLKDHGFSDKFIYEMGK